MIERFKLLINELFQFDSSELDFGIYRILKYKREQVEKFINQDLPTIVEKEFEKHKEENVEQIQKEFGNIKNELINSLGKNALTSTGEVKLEFKNTPIAKKYLEAKARLEEYNKIQEIESQVYNDLYNFFSRYYKDGDFLPKHRFSIKNYRYAIPYNGEEVKLYWANYDQYYIKTGLLFRDYTFKCVNNAYTIIFRTVSAKEEINSNKATKSKYFILTDENPIEFGKNSKTLVIRFEYRELTPEEKNLFGFPDKESQSKIQKELITPKIIENILNSIPDSILKEGLIKEKKQDLGILEYHLNRFIAKNTRDYFIHKNLKKSLSEQLDYFIKAEVLNLDDILKSKYFDKHITRANVVKEVGEKIIDFLASIEEFQKKLWEKKKFVIKTEYVITLDKIKEIAGEEFLESILDEILNNEKQAKEWKELGFGEVKTKEALLSKNDLTGKEYKKLPVDTKYFSQDFKERLLEKLTEKLSLDDLLDGILIKSENWQALNLLKNKYKGRVWTIYIDPPFKTGKDFIYMDYYQTSSWIALMENRIQLAKEYLTDKGSFFIHLDWNANYLGRILLDNIFPVITEIIWNTNATKDEEAGLFSYKSFGEKYVRQHDTIFQCSKSEGYKFIKLWKPNRRTTKLPIGWLDLISLPKSGIENTQRLDDYEFFIEKYDNKGNFKLQKIKIHEKVFPIGDIWNDIYHFTQSELRTSENISFDTQKPENLLRRIIQSTTTQGDIIMDFFAGSGTTLTVAHKLQRRWIGIEMGDYFNEFYFDIKEKKLGLLGRIKIVLRGDKEFLAIDKNRRSHLSKDINWQGSGFFKYHYLEQYEDSLDNIEFKKEEQGQKLMELFPDYIKYMLDYETEGSPSLLNIDLIEDPFSYKLKVNLKEVGESKEELVDLIETFNYLVGLKIDQYRFKELNGKKYVFVYGEKEFKKVVVIWRNIKGFAEEDYKRDREFIREELKDKNVDRVYLNGQSFLEKEINGRTIDLLNIEVEFKKLMFEKPV